MPEPCTFAQIQLSWSFLSPESPPPPSMTRCQGVYGEGSVCPGGIAVIADSMNLLPSAPTLQRGIH